MTRDRRTFGRLRKLPSGRYQAAYVGPDDKFTLPSQLSERRSTPRLGSPTAAEKSTGTCGARPRRGEQKKATTQGRHVKFGDYAETWVETRTVKGKPLRPRTQAHYRSLLKQHILPTFETKAVARITRESVERWYNNTASDTPTLRAHAYSLLRAGPSSSQHGPATN